MNPSDTPDPVTPDKANGKPPQPKSARKQVAKLIREGTQKGNRVNPGAAARSAKKAPAPKKGTKTAKVLTMLQRSDGASLKELQKVTGWQAHSLRGFLSVLKKKMSIRINFEPRHKDRTRAYRLISK